MSRKISDFFKPTQLDQKLAKTTKIHQIKTEPEANFEINFDDLQGAKLRNLSNVSKSCGSQKNEIQQLLSKIIKLETTAEPEAYFKQETCKSIHHQANQEKPTNKITNNIKTEPEQILSIILPPKSHQIDTKNHENLLKCKFCGVAYDKKGSLIGHIRTKHPIGPPEKYECDFDGKIFDSRCAFLAHMRSHRSNVVCKICSQEMKFLSLKDHMKSIHSDERNYKCKICSKSFKLPCVLKNHLRSHDKKYECNICGKKVRNGQDLKFHIKQFHENPRSFKCEICEKGFFDKGNLKKHTKTHDKNREKAYKCERCSYSSDNKAHFKLHQDFHKRWDGKIAGGKNPIKCKICAVMFKDKKHLSSHMGYVHPRIVFQCDLCGMYSKTKANFEKHMRTVHLKNKLTAYNAIYFLK